MNYRTMVKGALAFSLSLIVGSSWAAKTTQTDVPTYGATFESAVSTVAPLNDFPYTEGDGITNAKYRVTQEVEQPYGWFAGSADDESKIITANGGQALQLNTDASTLTNQFDAAKATELNAAITTTSSAFFETEVKFVASDTDSAGIEGGTDATKFAIYAYCNEEAETVTTNLVVYHGVMNPSTGDITYTNEVFESVTIDTEAYTKLRIEMKKMTDPVDPSDPSDDAEYNVFSVKVGSGEPISSKTAFDALLNGTEAGTWFLTTENTDVALDMKVASLNFKGTGEIDNISIGTISKTTEYAIDWTASEGVVVSNLTAGVQLAAGDTNFVAGVQLGFYPTVGTIQSVTVDGAAETVADPYVYTVGTADAIVTVVAAQVLDDNWTIVGLNPRGEWTDPTAVAADSKTLFYSNLVVNIDPIDATEGRSIVAAWIGARIVAPEAVTSANASQWTIGIGNATYTFDQIKESEGNFFNLWVPVTAEKVRTAIATQSDIVYTVEAYTDPSAKQILSMVINPMNIEITNTGDVEGGDTIDVDDWEENVPAVPTVITIALVNGATYTDAAGVLTFAAPEGYVVNSIYTNGVNTGSTTTFTTNGLTGTINIVAAAKKVRPAVAHKWYENPGLVQAFNYPYYVDQQTGFHWDIDSTDAFLAAPSGFTGGGALLFSVDSLEATNSASIYQFAKNEAPLSLASIRGSAVAPQLNVMLIGSYNNTGLVSLPLSAEVFAWDENAFHIYTDNGVTPDSFHFSDDGLTLYATASAPNSARNYVFKYRVLDGLKSSGTNLVLEASWNVGSRTRALEIAKVGNTTFAYVHSGAGIKVIDVDDSSSAPVDAGASAEGDYDDMDVSGTHFYIYHGETGKLRIFDIAADGKLSLFKTITQDELAAAFGCTSIKIATSAGLAVTDDEKTIFFTNFDGGSYTAAKMTFFVAQYVEPPTPTYDVDWTGSDGVTVMTNSIALAGTSGTFEENTVITFTPDQDTTITNILVGGVAQTGFDPASFSLTVVSDTNIVVLAGAAASADEFKAGDTYGDVTLTAAQAEWLNGFDNYAAIDTALKTDSSSLEKRYLLNVDPLTGDGTLTLTAITVGSDVRVTIALSRTEGETAVTGKAIKGTLKLYGASDLTVGFGSEPLGSTTIVDDDFSEGDTTTATFTGSGAKFFKAVIE